MPRAVHARDHNKGEQQKESAAVVVVDVVLMPGASRDIIPPHGGSLQSINEARSPSARKSSTVQVTP